MRRVAVVVLLALFFALGTWLGGWWAIPLLSAVAGVWRRAWESAVAAAAAWGALLVIDTFGSRFGALSGSVAGVIGVPSPALVVITLILAWVLAWSAAALVHSLVAEPRRAS